MAGTDTMIMFLQQTKSGLQILASQLSDVRFDLFGTMHRKDADAMVAPTPPDQDPSNMDLFGAVEYLAGGINESLNRLSAEIAFLQSNVNHKVPPAPVASASEVGRYR
jgi:hypothetical protein